MSTQGQIPNFHEILEKKGRGCEVKWRVPKAYNRRQIRVDFGKKEYIEGIPAAVHPFEVLLDLEYLRTR